ncbi:uracil-DNA glycosylase [Halostella sp. JP-L12]|uniref:uracil-DNA glycosylase n=1 Tax=Halostella TaxID=1843185 RepID=UPI000EF7CF07|nr:MULTISPECIES: uracil-DNA glycosylase [Halostella]NHN49770.1 uracil-DNA glycosylase [Halostella sp. JP-L12]
MSAFDDEFAAVLDEVPDEHFDRERFVPGAGEFDADVMLVGEAPGGNEVKQGEPFVGQAGQQLDRILEDIGIAREDLYVTNLVKVRPPENRDPYVEEIDAWRPVMEAELDRVDPDVVVPLGSFATQEILDTDETITDLRGETFERGGRLVRPTFHPAAALYDRSKLPQITEDLERALTESGG